MHEDKIYLLRKLSGKTDSACIEALKDNYYDVNRALQSLKNSDESRVLNNIAGEQKTQGGNKP